MVAEPVVYSLVTVTMMLSVVDTLLIIEPSVAKLLLPVLLVVDVVVVSKIMPLLEADEIYSGNDARNTTTSDAIITSDDVVATLTIFRRSQGCCDDFSVSSV